MVPLTSVLHHCVHVHALTTFVRLMPFKFRFGMLEFFVRGDQNCNSWRQDSIRQAGTGGVFLKCGDWLTVSLVGLLGPESECTIEWLLPIWVFKGGLSFFPVLGTKEAVVLR